jgi:hypothetical protein
MSGKNRLAPNEHLGIGDRLVSPNGRYDLILQASDGNLVLYRQGGAPLWAAHSVGGAMLAMQGDGNAVIYDRAWNPIWATNTSWGASGASLSLQSDGNLVLYAPDGVPLWATNTAEPQPEPVGRNGRVRIDGRVARDDDGSYRSLGLPVFWAVRGLLDGETERVRRHFAWVREQGAHFARVFAETSDWTAIRCADGVTRDRTTHPSHPRWAAALRETRDLAKACGIRLYLTLFGGNRLTPAEQERVVGEVIAVGNEAPEVFEGVEVSNENNGFHDHDGPRRMRGFAAMLAAHGFPVTLTSFVHNEHVYPGSAANWTNVHFERTYGDEGWRWVRQPWGAWVGEGGLTGPFGTLEPGGPGASVVSDTDPLRVAMAATHTWLCGGTFHVMHCGAGIFGVETIHPTAGFRPANLWEQPALAEALAILRGAGALLPDDLANWARCRHGKPEHPFTFEPEVGDPSLGLRRGCVRAYACWHDGRYLAVPIGLMGDFTLTTQRARDWALFRADGTPISSGQTGALGLRTRDHGRAVILTGVYS